MRGRDSVEFTGAVALGALAGALLALLWRRARNSDGISSALPAQRG